MTKTIIEQQEFNKLQLVYSTLTSLTKAAGALTGVATINHNLGYKPVAVVRRGSQSSTENSYAFPDIGVLQGTGELVFHQYATTDANTLTITLKSSDNLSFKPFEYTIAFRVWLFREIA